MARVFGCKMLALENMAEVATAARADNFNAPPVCVCHAFHRAFNFVVEAGPAASRIKFVVAPVELCIALAAGVNAGFVMLVVLTGTGVFGPFMEYDLLLFGGEGI